MHDDLVRKIKNEAHRIEEDAIFSSKGHFNAACCWGWCHYIIGIPTAVSAALSASKLLQNNDWASCFALLAAVLAAIQTLLNPEKKASIHQVNGRKYLSLINNTRNFREIELLQIQDEEKAVQKIKTLSDERNALNQTSPSIPRYSYSKAKRDIEAGHAAHHVDAKKSRNEL